MFLFGYRGICLKVFLVLGSNFIRDNRRSCSGTMRWARGILMLGERGDAISKTTYFICLKVNKEPTLYYIKHPEVTPPKDSIGKNNYLIVKKKPLLRSK